MIKYIKLVKALRRYLKDDFELQPENEHEIDVVNALYDIKTKGKK